MDNVLSKRLVLQGLQCHKQLWLSKHNPELAAEPSEFNQSIIDQGNLVETYARQCYPDGHLIAMDRSDMQKAIALTQAAVKEGKNVIFQGTAAHDGVTIRADILKRVNGKWDLIEVKSSSKNKPEHQPDIAVQWYVLEGSGIKLNRAYLMIINTEYVRNGDLDLSQLFKMVDMTDAIQEVLPEMPRIVITLKEVMKQADCPVIDIGEHCEDPNACNFKGHCWADVPEYSVFNIARLSWKKKSALRSMGIMRVADVPDDFDLSDIQRLQVTVEKTSAIHIDRSTIRRLLSKLKEPLYFLDFETISPAIPPYDGLKPYQKLAFQFSLRIQDGGSSKSVDFLGDGKEDPREDMARLLCENIGPEGSVLAYNAKFEGAILDSLAKDCPKYAAQLTSIRERIWDLMEPFDRRYYVHHRFNGSASIKFVLPALVSGKGYAGMGIKEGGAASVAYLKIMSGKLSDSQITNIRKDLIEYCGQDTESMMLILKVLQEELSN